MRAVQLFVAVVLACSIAVDAEAQGRQAQQKPRPSRPFVENGFVSLNAGALAALEDLSDRFPFEANAETGTLEADYGRSAGGAFDGTFGMLVHLSYSKRSASADVRAEVPHPFFDDRHRPVRGEATGIGHRETAIHAHVYYERRHRGPWRVRVFAGPSYVRVEQDLIIGVETQESFPFDSAAFRSATIERVQGSGIGVNAGFDVARMLSRRAGLGALVRYTIAGVDLNAPGGRDVSTRAGGLTSGFGLRVAF
jgi:hypothetical protein